MANNYEKLSSTSKTTNAVGIGNGSLFFIPNPFQIMANPTYIDANEFMETLLAKGLVIVSVKELQINKEIDRNRLMRRKALSLSEIVRAELLPLKTVKGVNDWILSGKIKPGEWYNEKSGYKRVMVLTAAIKRLGYGE